MEPRKIESDWARARSTIRPTPLLSPPRLRVDIAPVEEVNTTELMVTLKLIIPIFAGRVSETRVRLTLAVVPVPQLLPQPLPLGRPLQEARERHATRVRKRKAL